MITRDNPYFKQVGLLVRVLPHLARETAFALKGGTAINLFYRDMPRLSVDLDLVYLPVEERQATLTAIDAALRRIAVGLGKDLPGLKTTFNSVGGAATTVHLEHERTRVKVEANHVFRGTVGAPESRELAGSAIEAFGYGATKLASFEDVYAGKLLAALDRQHPRDLFDVHFLFENEGISDALFRTFIAYLLGHNRTFSEVLDPVRKDISALFNQEFEGMALTPLPLANLIETRERLIAEIHQRLGDNERAFLLSFKRREPEWHRLGVPGAEQLPAIRWKLDNLAKMPPDNYAAALARLETLFATL